MLSAAFLRQIDDSHLIAAASAGLGPADGTALERELLRRMEALLDEQRRNRPAADLLDEFDTSAGDIRAVLGSHPARPAEQAALLALLNSQDIHRPEQLVELFECAARFCALASDAGDFFARLNELVAAYQE